MDAPWRIELLGCLRASQAERVVHRFRSRKAAALLAYLAFYRDRSHRREQLIELLWPERPREAGRLNLRVELVSLRRQLEPPGVPAGTVILADRASVQLNPAAVTTDVAQFQASLEAARAGAGAEQARRLTAAVELYRGELLPGYYEEWVLPERRRLEERFLQALRQLTTLSEQGGERDQALHWAARMVTADPLWEEGQYALIRLLAAAGQPAAALRQYQELQRALQQLGTVPGAKTRALAEQIRERGAGRRGDGATGRRVDGTKSPTLAGPSLSSRVAPSPCPPVPGEPLPSGTVTFLLTDIEASTARWEQVGDAFRPARGSHHQLLRQLFRQHGGHEVKEMGDGFLVAFQRVDSALACAVAAQRALAAHAWPAAVGPLRVRMGLHTGDAEPEGGDYHALALHYADRVVEAGHGGQILCSEETAGWIRGDREAGVWLVDLGTYRLRGVELPARLFQVNDPERAPREFPPLRAPRAVPGHLPLRFTRFIGREAEIARLRAMLLGRAGGRQPSAVSADKARDAVTDSRRPTADSPRLVTLTGPGGTGKTRLALEVARGLWDSFHGAVWFVDLADLADPRLIADRVLETLRLPRSPTLAPLDQVIAALAEQPSLLLLDNFEHLVSEGALLVQTLLERVERLTVLVTSRQRLNLAGEREFRVLPLPTPPPAPPLEGEGGLTGAEHLLKCASVQLFVDRAQAVDADFQVTEANAAAVAALCEKLEGLPLALELAAARAGVLTPAQMLGQLSRRFDFLVSRQPDAGPRQRSMRATCDWSYQLLAPELQRFLARLSVFRGGWNLEAAAAVCEDVAAPQPGPALEHLSQLLESSLIQAEAPDAHPVSPGGRRAMGEPEMRYRFFEIVREYAAEQLPPEEQASTARRHAEHFLALAERADLELTGTAQEEWLDRLEREHDNLRAALDWAGAKAEAEVGLRLGGALGRFWNVRGHYSEGRERLARLLAMVEAGPAEGEGPGLAAARAKVLQGLAILICWLGDYEQARLLQEQSVATRQELGDPVALADALAALGLVAHFQGDFGAARDALGESLAIGRELGDKETIAASLRHLGDLLCTQGEYKGARTLFEESLKLRRELGDEDGISKALRSLGWVIREQGDLETARTLYEKSLVIDRELCDKAGIALSLSHLGETCSLHGDGNAARRYFEESRVIWRELGDPTGIAWSLAGLGRVADLQGEYEAAGSLHEQSLAVRRELGNRQSIADSLSDLARVVQHQGDGERAAALWRESLALFREQGSKKGIAACLEGLVAATVEVRDGAEWAARLLGAAEALREALGTPLPPVDRADHERCVAAVRSALSEAAFAAAWAEGRAMELEQAVAYALEGAR